MGPGLLLKAAAPRRISLVAFGTVQVAIDLETWYYLTNGDVPIHRTLHTFLFGGLFSLAIGLLVLGIGWVTHTTVAPHVSRLSIGQPLSVLAGELSASGIFAGVILGATTHALLDGIMHGDIKPFAPFTDANPLVGLVGWDPLHLICVALGVAGGLWLLGQFATRRAT
jgi:hypothetical protein